MSDHEVKWKKLERALNEVYLSSRNQPKKEEELAAYLASCLGVLASRMANQGSDTLEEICTQLGSDVYSTALEFLKVRER